MESPIPVLNTAYALLQMVMLPEKIGIPWGNRYTRLKIYWLVDRENNTHLPEQGIRSASKIWTVSGCPYLLGKGRKTLSILEVLSFSVPWSNRDQAPRERQGISHKKHGKKNQLLTSLEGFLLVKPSLQLTQSVPLQWPSPCAKKAANWNSIVLVSV